MLAGREGEKEREGRDIKKGKETRKRGTKGPKENEK